MMAYTSTVSERITKSHLSYILWHKAFAVMDDYRRFAIRDLTFVP